MDPHAQLDVDALLREEARIRYLARGLVGDEARAEDVTQDVVAAALHQRPKARGRELRAWLATVTRRAATRARRKEASVRRLEQAAARPERVEDPAHVLELHRQLHAGLDGLAPMYRDALVLRYLQEMSFEEVAERLGTNEATARKRVSRGLALLRERLDETYGERAAWIGAFGSLASEKALSPPIIASTGAVISVVSLITMKKLLLGGLAAVLIVLAGVRVSRAVRSAAIDPPSSETRMELATNEMTTPSVAANNELRPTAGSARIAVESSPKAAPDLAVTDTRARRVAHARAACIDDAGRVHMLISGGDGTFALPAGVAARHFYAMAEGLAGGYAPAVDDEAGVTIELGELVTLRGRLEVDGSVPAEPVALWRVSFNDHRPLHAAYPLSASQAGELDRLGFGEPDQETRTSQGGRFEFQGVFPDSRGSLNLPGSYRALPEGIDSSVRYLADGSEHVIPVERLPYAFGRVVWADDGSPASGRLHAIMRRHANGTGDTRGGFVDSSGVFEVGIPHQDRGQRDLGLAFDGITLEFFPTLGSPAEHGFEFRFEPEDLPLGIGVLELSRATSVEIRLLDQQGQPIQDGFVVGPLRTERTSAEGRVNVAVHGGRALTAIAEGFFATELISSEFTPDSTNDVTLNRSSTLVITTPEESWPLPEPSGRRIALHYDSAMFLDLSASGEPAPSRDYRLARLVNPDRFMSNRYRQGSTRRHLFFSLSDQPLLLTGLEPGIELLVELINDLKQPVASQLVVVPDGSETIDVPLIPDQQQLGLVHFEVVGMNGQAVADAKISLRCEADDRPFPRSTPKSTGWIATGNYVVSIRSPQFRHYESERFVQAGEQTARIVLAPARIVTLTSADPSGTSTQPDCLHLSDGSGWEYEIGGDPSPGGWKIASAPVGRIDVVARYGAHAVTASIAPGETSLALLSPALGSLRATVAELPEGLADWGEIELFCDALDLPASRARSDRDSYERWGCGQAGAPVGHARFEAMVAGSATGPIRVGGQLVPGRYAVEIAYFNDGNDEDTRRSLFVTEVTIEAGVETRIEVPPSFR